MMGWLIQLSLWALMGASLLGYLGVIMQSLSVGFLVAGFCLIVLYVTGF